MSVTTSYLSSFVGTVYNDPINGSVGINENILLGASITYGVGPGMRIGRVITLDQIDFNMSFDITPGQQLRLLIFYSPSPDYANLSSTSDVAQLVENNANGASPLSTIFYPPIPSISTFYYDTTVDSSAFLYEDCILGVPSAAYAPGDLATYTYNKSFPLHCPKAFDNDGYPTLGSLVIYMVTSITTVALPNSCFAYGTAKLSYHSGGYLGLETELE